MAKIQFRIRDKDKKALANATLLMRCKLNDGSKWSSDVLTMTSPGVIWSEFPDKTFKLFNRKTIQFKIIKDGVELTYAKPEFKQIHDSTYRVIITVSTSDSVPNEHDETSDDSNDGLDDSDSSPTSDDVPPPAVSDEEKYHVFGKILFANGKPAEKYYVVAYDRGICEESVLGKSVSGEDGRYDITYFASDFTDSQKPTADLIVRVFKTSRLQKIHAASPLFIGANADQEVNLSVDKSQYKGRSLYEVADAKVVQLVREKNWDCLEPQDLMLISDRTGLDYATVTQISRAKLFAQNLIEHGDKTEQTDAVMFAILRASYAPGLSSICAKSDYLLAKILTNAVSTNVIPFIDVDAYLKGSRNARAKLVADSSQNLPLSVFKMAKLDSSQVQVATAHFLEQKTKGAAWNSLAKKKGFTVALVKEIKSVVLGAQLLDGNLSLLDAAHRKLKSTDPRKLASLGRADWADLLAKGKIRLPNTVPGGTKKEKVDYYVNGIARSIESQYPTAVFTQQWMADSTASKGVIKTAFTKYPEFDFESGSFTNFVSKQEGLSLDKLKPLARLEALYRLAPPLDKFRTVKALWDSGISSGLEVGKLGKSKFRKDFSDVLGGNAQADEVFAVAQGQLGSNLVVMAQASAQINSINMNVLPSVSAQLQQNSSLKSAYEQFYGPLSLVNCEHCQSNLSPAAYLVDLLGFLERASNNSGKNGRELFAERRPEIELLEVSCANTDTLMPYIDLVLEVLENAVSPQAPFAPQSTKSAEELAAEPEIGNVNLAAYEKLENQNYPWNLPFDYEVEHSRAFLDQAGVPRHELIRFLRKFDNDLPLDAACEYLGLTPKQAALVAVPVFGNAAKNLLLAGLWGFRQFADLIGANQIENVMDRTGLSLDELKALFNSKFVNPAGIEHFNQNGTIQNLNAEVLDRSHRLGRLYHLSHYTIESLDLMLGVAKDGIALIPELAAISFLEQEANISLQEISDAWGLPESERAESFAKLFNCPEQDAHKLEKISALPWNTPITAMVLWEYLDALDTAGISLSDAYDLLTAPDEESVYAEDVIESAISKTIEALTLSAQEEPLEFESSSLTTSGSPQLESIVTITLVDETSIEVPENQAKQNEVIVETLSSELSLDPEQVNDLLYLNPSEAALSFDQVIAAATSAELIDSTTRFAKQVTLLTKLGLGARSFSDLVELSTQSDLLSLASLPVSGDATNYIAALHNLVSLSNVELDWGLGDAAFIRELAKWGSNPPAYNGLAQAISEVTEWSLSDLDFMLSSSGFHWQSVELFIKNNGWFDMAKAVSLAKGLNDTVQVAWIYKDKSYYQSIKASLAYNYTDEDWLAVCAQVTDTLREKQRDALLGWVIKHGTGPLAPLNNELDVYNHFLLDPEMSACFDTSRIVQATGSVQQFIQRVLLSLEDDLVFGTSDQKAWEWRKNYRVWEANRKVFLYPENWIEPELRHNKTELFHALESQLLQGSLTSENAEAALLDYAKNLHDISNLEMCGFCEDVDSESNIETLFLFARTRGVPNQYYLAKRIDQVWTSWEGLDVDIQGDHLMPVFNNSRLYLYWLVFEETEIKLAWSVFENGQWRPSKLSEAALASSYGEKIIYATSRFVNGELVISVAYKYHAQSDMETQQPIFDTGDIGRFFVGACGDNVSLTSMNGQELIAELMQISFVSVLNSTLEKQKLLVPDSELSLVEYTTLFQISEEQIDLLESIQGQQGFVLFSSHNHGSAKAKPFIFEDAKASYYVTKEHDAPGNPIVEIPPPVDMPTPPEHPPVDIPYPIPSHPPIIWDHWGVLDDIVIDSGGSNLDFDDLINSASVYSGELDEGRVVLNDTPLRASYVEPSTSYGSVATSVENRAMSVGMSSLTFTDQHHFFAYPKILEVTPNSQEFLFKPLYHPYTCLYIRQLYKYGSGGLYQPDPGSSKHDDEDLYQQRTLNSPYDFDQLYQPTDSVINEYPVEQIDFSLLSPYGLYNNEMFFYAPMLIATRLMQNQKFEEARKWFHYIFDPTSTDGQGGARLWRFSIFAKTHNGLMSGNINQFFGDPEKFSAQYQQWIEHPFNPHAIAQTRVVAYMRYVIMRYLDNLLAWGDYLYRQDTRESINEATQLYVLAAQMLGPRPAIIDGIDTGPKSTVRDILDGTESTQFSFDTQVIEGLIADDEAIGFLGELLTFCVPQNDKLLGYWDTVSDRLFKIRHCMNIDGMVRSLALFQPPIDPALLVRAAAAGISISSVVAGLSTVGRPVYRFTYMLARAYDFLSEVKQLGLTLLSTLEKQDAEELAAIRSVNEVELLKLMEEQKKLSLDEATENLLSEKKSSARLEVTKDYYEMLIDEGVLDAEKNQDDMDLLSTILTTSASVADGVGALVSSMPETSVGIAAAVTWGGTNLSNVSRAVAGGFRAGASIASFQSGMLGKNAARYRREKEWQFQLDAVVKDIEQTDQKIVAAEVRVALATKDLSTFKTQIEQTKQADSFLRSKFTNVQLYAWLKNEISTLYFQAYQLAYDMAKKAEIAYRHELGDASAGFVGFGNWDSLHKGLLAGDRLSLDLRRMEQSYIENNKRDLELTKNISIALLNPSALLSLKNTGECEIDLPEFIFDFDYPGQYSRRIKSVSLSIPCITGPYTNVNCTLSLLKSSIRRDVDVRDASGLEPLVTIAGQRIATSSAQSDSGVFQLDFSDERFLPFEGEGAISSWRLQLSPPELAQFDYDSISDVILHMNYTAKFAENARLTVKNELVDLTGELASILGDLPLMLDLGQTFPDEWSLFKFGAVDETELDSVVSMTLQKNHFPFVTRNRTDSVSAVEIYIEAPDSYANQQISLSIAEDSRPLVLEGGLLKSKFENLSFDISDWAEIDDWAITIPPQMTAEIESIVVLISYNIKRV